VKLVRTSPETVILNIAHGERRLFVEILNLYPVVPAAYQPLSRSLKDKVTGEEQELLNEALAEQRAALRQHVQAWLRTRNRFRPVKSGFNFTLRRTDAEWLLQVLNDIRVGHWLLLGAPDEMPDEEDLKSLEPDLHHTWLAMELSGMFQMKILSALEAGHPG
jgi:hypothetical protein